jgi:hypothetical protein
MSTSESLEALRRANPRKKASFNDAVDAAAAAVRLRIATAESVNEPSERHLHPPRRLVGLAAGVALAGAAAVAVLLTVGSSDVTPGVDNAAAAIKKAARQTAVSVNQSGTATVHMTHDGQVSAHKTVRWHGEDMEITDESPGGPSSGLPLLLVNGMVYGHDPAHEGWVEVGPVSSFDRGIGTTPADIVAAVRNDLGGATLRRITRAMTAGGLTTSQSDGSTLFAGSVPAGKIARETGFKEGQAIRVFPFGYVAHGAAADPTSPLDTQVTVESDGIIREIAVRWGTWTYTVTYSDLDSTPALVAPPNAEPLNDEPVTTTSA